MTQHVASNIEIQRKFLRSVEDLGIRESLIAKATPMHRHHLYVDIDRHMKVNGGLSKKIFAYMKQRYQYEKKKIPGKRTYALYDELDKFFEPDNEEEGSNNQQIVEQNEQGDLSSRREISRNLETIEHSEVKEKTLRIMMQRVLELGDPAFQKFVKTVKTLIWNNFSKRNQRFEGNVNHNLSRYPVVHQAEINLDRIFNQISTPAALLSFVSLYMDELDVNEMVELNRDFIKIVEYSKKIERRDRFCFLQ
ncbi:unnamed protein product [Bursaphelenchus xylophilus]|uniref:(pine wood nematode) hypothetical protein n=1 Tax=Bursaphelenchus xylophilus TaxID=6326 RepID=A0A1I7SVW4_BURXY|nr:unnamed protein product [Bursaphelenchus xylophilus]CAG9098393.1 unnamed protein product [Bursaphelenchus xylophilus]